MLHAILSYFHCKFFKRRSFDRLFYALQRVEFSGLNEVVEGIEDVLLIGLGDLLHEPAT